MEMMKKSNTDDIQDVLAAYLQEIKKENLQLQYAAEETPAAEEQPVQGRDDSHPIPAAIKPAGTEIYENEQKDYVETSLHSSILQLHDKGFSETEIARKLNCGKTEAALIIKLYS
jgi:DNA-binding NarL/FixJ family response regulator